MVRWGRWKVEDLHDIVQTAQDHLQSTVVSTSTVLHFCLKHCGCLNYALSGVFCSASACG